MPAVFLAKQEEVTCPRHFGRLTNPHSVVSGALRLPGPLLLYNFSRSVLGRIMHLKGELIMGDLHKAKVINGQ